MDRFLEYCWNGLLIALVVLGYVLMISLRVGMVVLLMLVSVFG